MGLPVGPYRALDFNQATFNDDECGCSCLEYNLLVLILLVSIISFSFELKNPFQQTELALAALHTKSEINSFEDGEQNASGDSEIDTGEPLAFAGAHNSGSSSFQDGGYGGNGPSGFLPGYGGQTDQTGPYNPVEEPDTDGWTPDPSATSDKDRING